MNSSLRLLEPFCRNEWYGMLVRGGAVAEIMVMRAGHCIAAIPLTAVECGVIGQALRTPDRLQPVTGFYLALREAYAVGGDSGPSVPCAEGAAPGTAGCCPLRPAATPRPSRRCSRSQSRDDSLRQGSARQRDGFGAAGLDMGRVKEPKLCHGVEHG